MEARVLPSQLNCREEADRTISFIRNTVKPLFHKSGAVIGISGGVDSAVTAALCVAALGSEQVRGVALPEKESNKDSLPAARELAKALNIELDTVDITPVLESLGAYRNIMSIVTKSYPMFVDGYKYKICLPQDILSKEQLNIYSLKILNEKDEEVFSKRLSIQDYRGIRAAASMKLRVRMIELYYYAEKLNYAVAGTTNRSEYTLGNYCKYGDGGVDFEVISNLYKSQVYQMANYLGIPKKIIERVPSPDIFSGYVSDSEFFFSMPFDDLDSLISAYDLDIGSSECATMLGKDIDLVERVYRDFARKKIVNRHLTVIPQPKCRMYDTSVGNNC